MDHKAHQQGSGRLWPLVRGIVVVMIAAVALSLATWLTDHHTISMTSSAHAGSLLQPASPTGRPIYTARELADGELAVLDAETVLAHWNAEIELCSRMVDQLASLANEDVSGKARLSPYPGMLSKALNARQDATLALARAKGRFEAMKRINTEAMTLAPANLPASGR